MTNACCSLTNCDGRDIKKNKLINCFFSLGRLHGGQTQLCRRALGRGYLDWTLCKVRIVWTRLICRAGVPCVSCGGGRWRREGAGWPLHAPVKTGIWKALPSASHVSQVDTQQTAPNPLHASAHTNTAGENRQTRKLTRTQRRINSHGTVSGVGR